MNPPRAFFDADVLFAGAASPSEHGASLILLQMGQWGLLACGASEQAVAEAERNITRKLPARLTELRSIIQRAMTIVPDPTPEDLAPYQGLADAKDIPILVAALQHGFPRLISFNTRHYRRLRRSSPSSGQVTSSARLAPRWPHSAAIPAHRLTNRRGHCSV